LVQKKLKFNQMFNTPILFLIFNRQDTTTQVFEAIKNIKPAHLYIAADGPRMAKPCEFEKCQETRNIVLNGIDWDCEVKTFFRDDNLGCGKAVSSAITWFFENVEEGIILEDDCLPHPDFFPYCATLLERYKDNSQIMFIGGGNFQNGIQRGDSSYYFSAYSHVWGWASWRRAWEKYDFTLESISYEKFEDILSIYFQSEKVKESWKLIFNKMKNNMIDTWDFQLAFSIWANNGICIIPNVNLISNIGFGEDATHTLAISEVANMPTLGIIPLQHLQNILIDKKADKYYFENFVSKSIFKRIVSKIKRLLN